MSMLAAAAVLTITVRVYDMYGVPPPDRAKALALAADTLAQANVRAQWIDCTRDEHDVVPPRCRAALEPGELVVRILDKTSRDGHILGTAIVQEGGPNVVASIYARSTAERSARSGVPIVTLLGRVTAHEIGHLLLGTNSHTLAGIMRAKWNLKVPYPVEWQFTSADAAKIRRRMLAPGDSVVARADE
jgi:hypothetical protein